MKDILQAKFLKEFTATTSNMYRMGWDERNGGNISLMLEEKEVQEYLDTTNVIRTIPIGYTTDEILVGKYFLITGTGKYFKNVEFDPEVNLGIIRIAKDRQTAELIWGFVDGGQFTSECYAHLMSHAVRLQKDPMHRVILHTHPTYTIAMNAVCPIDEKDFTHKLWQSNTESVVVFPDGVGLLPCMVCGTMEIGLATAEKMKDFRLVMWTNHGLYGAGRDLDEAFGLVETVEKTAQIYMLAHAVTDTPHIISDEIIKALAYRFGVKILDGVLS